MTVNGPDTQRFFFRSKFLREVAYQARLGVRAADQLDAGLAQGDDDGVWLAIHALLTTAGNVSNLLWGGSVKPLADNAEKQARRERKRERVGFLQRALTVPADSPLKSRSLRDIWVHYDEYLDNWAAEGMPYSDDRNVARGPVTFQALPAGYRLRHFDAASYVLSFGELSIPLRPLFDALRTLASDAADKAEYMFATGEDEL
jgi:hypothetical protein